jgi:hypothetical protein
MTIRVKQINGSEFEIQFVSQTPVAVEEPQEPKLTRQDLIRRRQAQQESRAVAC